MKKVPFFSALLCSALILCHFSLTRAVNAEGTYQVAFPVVTNSVSPQLLGPFMAKVVALAVDPQQQGVVYAGTWGNGIFKSVDFGATWFPANNGLTNLIVQTLAVDPSNSQNVYAGMFYDPRSQNGVYKSSDGGQTWRMTGKMENKYNGTLISRPIVYALVVDPTNSNILYAGTRMQDIVPGQAIYGGGGIFKSIDQGLTWVTVNQNLPPDDLYVYGLTVNPKNPTEVFAAMHLSGPYVSENRGASWSPMKTNPTIDLSARVVLLDWLNPHEIYYGSWYQGQVDYTNDLGAHWYPKGPLGTGGVFSIVQDPHNRNYLLAVSMGSAPNVIHTQLYISSDQSDTWNVINSDNYWRVAFDPFINQRVYGSTDTGMKFSQDRGKSWVYSNKGLAGYSTTAMVAISPTSYFAALYGYGVVKSIDGGKTWQSSNRGLPGELTARALAVDPNHPEVLYLTSDTSGAFRSTNSGGNWSAITSGYPSAAPVSGEIDQFNNHPLASPERYPPSDPIIASPSAVSAPGTAIAISPDTGTTLLGTQARGIVRFNGSSAWTSTSLSTGTIHTILFDRKTVGTVLAGANGGDGSLYLSTDSGAHWVSSSSGLAGRTVFALCQSQTSPGTIWAGTDSGVYRSDDSGASWVLVGLQELAITALNAHPAVPDRIMAGTSNSTYLSRDGGWTWEKGDALLDQYGIQAITQDPTNPDFVFLSTRFQGVIWANR